VGNRENYMTGHFLVYVMPLLLVCSNQGGHDGSFKCIPGGRNTKHIQNFGGETSWKLRRTRRGRKMDLTKVSYEGMNWI
jgi:hypothetical protein